MNFCRRNSPNTILCICLVIIWCICICIWVAYRSEDISGTNTRIMKQHLERLFRFTSKLEMSNNDKHSAFGSVNTKKKNVYCNILKYNKVVNESFICLQPKKVPIQFDICIHDLNTDTIVSRYIAKKGEWEIHILTEMLEILDEYPNAGFIDAGANIGYFSLAAAAMGHKVVAIEPFIQNADRIRHSVIKNGFTDRVIIVQNGLSNHRQKAGLIRSRNNQGNTRLNDTAAELSTADEVGLITLNDLLEVINFDTAIMKMDIQGYEHKAFYKERCTELLQSVNIRYIFLEWEIVKTLKNGGVFKQNKTDMNMVDDMVLTLVENGFAPYTLKYKGLRNNSPSSVPLMIGKWQSWPDDIIWHKVKK